MNLEPSSQLNLFSHREEFKKLINLYKNNNLPNKILFSGEKGIGKCTLAYHLINYILSSNEDVALPKDYCFAAEVGLSGEIRPVQRVEQRILEAEKLGFTTIFVSKYNKISLKNTVIKIQLVSKIEDLVGYLV